jgi:hypothetical protein
MSTPGPDWVEQARRFAAGLAAEHAGGTGLSDVLGDLIGGRSAPGTAPGTAPGGTAGHGTECRSCPLCAGLAALRGHRPDLLEALADVLTSAATALRSTARPTPDGAAAAPAPEPTAPPEETVPHPAPVPTVQRIDVA